MTKRNKNCKEDIILPVKKIDRCLTPEEALRDSRLTVVGNITLATNLPTGTGSTERVILITLEEPMSHVEVINRVSDLGYKPASLLALLECNKKNPTFSDKKPHFVVTADDKGRIIYAAFYKSPEHGPSVQVYSDKDDWPAGYSVACRKN